MSRSYRAFRMPIRSWQIFTIAFLLLPTITSGDCNRFTLSPEPTWVFSGVEVISTDDGESIVVADPAEGRLIRYRAQQDTQTLLGETQEVVYPPGFRIGILQASAGGYLLSDPRGTFLRLDPEFSVLENFDVLAPPRPKGTPELASVVQWSPYGEDVIVFGDIAVSESNWVSGIAHIKANQQDVPAPLEIVHQIAVGDPARRFFYLGQPLIATIDPGRSYFFAKNELFQVHQNTGTFVRSTERSSVEFAEIPPIPDSIKNSEVVELFRRAAQNQGPAGVYAWRDEAGGDALFVLERDSTFASGWGMRKLSANADGLLTDLGRVELPTAGSSSLTVIPGRRSWTFIERGPVQGWDDITIKTAWRISSDLMKNWPKASPSGSTPLCSSSPRLESP